MIGTFIMWMTFELNANEYGHCMFHAPVDSARTTVIYTNATQYKK